MVAPQVSGLSNEDSTWKIVTHKKRNKREESFFSDEEFPPLPKSSSAEESQSDSDNSSDKTRRTTNKTKLRKFFKLISPDIDGLKPRKSNKDPDESSEDDMSTKSSTSNSMGNDHKQKCKRKLTYIKKEPKHVLLSKDRKQGDVKKEDDDIEEIIKKIENEHISTFHDMENRTTSLEYSSDSSSQTEQHQVLCKEEPRIKAEVAFSARTAVPPEDSTTIKQAQEEKQEQDNNTFEEQMDSTELQDALDRIQEDIFTIEDIKYSEEQVMSHIGIHKGTLDQSNFREWATDTSMFLKDGTDYLQHIRRCLPRLHDEIMPTSLRELAFLGPSMRTFINDWNPDGIERGAELERVEASLFYNQLKRNGMEHSFQELFEKLNYLWDEYGIPYNKRRKLLLVEIEMVSLIMCDVLPCNYSEQGIWVDDESQGRYYNFFKDKDVEKGRKKWYDLITPATYNWFWDIYTNYVGLSTLSDEQIVLLNDIFDIIKFINPPAIKMLLSVDSTVQKYMFIREKATICEPWVETRHHLYYIWIFYGFRPLPSGYPSYDPSGQNDIVNATRWVSKLMMTHDFYDNYDHFYVSRMKKGERKYFIYDTPPTRTHNWQRGENPSEFQDENGVYQGVRAADFSELYHPPNKKNPSLSKMSNLYQRVHHRAARNRICNYEYKNSTPTNIYYKSTELPVDWLIYYDEISRVSRKPTELYDFILKSVPYLILRNNTRRESYYYQRNQDLPQDQLIPSKSLHVTICHSGNTTNSTENQTI